MVLEHRGEHPSEWAAMCSIASKFWTTPKTLRIRVRRAEVDGGKRPGVTSEEKERIRQLELENRELRRADLIVCVFPAGAPNRLGGAVLTYVKAHAGWVSVAFIIDVYSRFIVGWQASRSLRADLARDAPEMPIWARRGARLDGLIHHSDRGVQYLAIRYTERLADASVAASVGFRGDSYDNALAESFNGLYKTEVIRPHRPWRGLDDVEDATLEHVDWFHQRRLHAEIGRI